MTQEEENLVNEVAAEASARSRGTVAVVIYKRQYKAIFDALIDALLDDVTSTGPNCLYLKNGTRIVAYFIDHPPGRGSRVTAVFPVKYREEFRRGGAL